MRAAQFTEFGGPEVLTVVDVPEPEAGPGQTLHDVSATGINYADTHQEGATPVTTRDAARCRLRMRIVRHLP
jgi:NADPH2:quinone reductase